MTILRPRLILDRESRDLRSALSLLTLTFLLSVWVHLVGFIVWEKLDLKVRDHFFFELADAAPPIMELTLILNEPEPEFEAPPGALTDEPATASPPAAAETPAAADPEAPQAAEPDLAQAELLPPDESRSAGLNPEPPIVLEGEAPKFKSYYTVIRSEVARNWILSPEARAQFRPSRLTVDFTVARDGTFLRLVVVQSTGSPSLDHAGLEAIRSAAPFPAFPQELRQYGQLDIRMHFDYQAQYIKRSRE